MLLNNFGKVIDNTAMFKYYAGRDTPNRPPASSTYITGDQEFQNTNQRQKVYNQSNDLYKNFSIMQFAINTHLDYICNYKFTARTTNKEFNKTLEKWIAKKSKKEEVDIYRRQSIAEIARMFYLQKIIFGDSFVLKVKNGKLQLIDPQMITKLSNNCPDDVNYAGVTLDKWGAVDSYAMSIVNKDNVREWVRNIPYKYMIVDAYYPNPTASRGVSPLITALNEAQDQMSLGEYTLIKAKLQSIFGLAIFRDTTIKGNHDFDYTQATNVQANQPLNYKLQPGLKLSLNKDDRVDFLESKTPNTTYFEFNKNLIRKMLASIGIPYVLYDSEGSSYSANRLDFYRYQFSVEKDRESFYNTLDQMYDFIIANGVINGELVLPSDIILEDIDYNYIPKTSFVLDATKETQAVIDKMNKCLISPQSAMLELGITDDIETVVAQTAYAQNLMREAGVTIELAAPGSATTQGQANGDVVEPVEPVEQEDVEEDNIEDQNNVK